MTITFKALEDIKKGEIVNLDFDTGELKVVTQNVKLELQPKEQPNIIEKGDHSLDGLQI